MVWQGGWVGVIRTRVEGDSHVTAARADESAKWAGGRGRVVWELGVGQRRLSTVLFDEGPDTGADRLGMTRNASGSGLNDETFHNPVMVDEAVSMLAPYQGGIYLDGTVGGGGHAEAVLRAAEGARLLGADRDSEAVERSRARLKQFGDRVTIAEGDYADSQQLFGLGEGTLAGVMLDLGVSSHQIDTIERGFSFRAGAPLDMRMSLRLSETAADLVNRLEKKELAQVFRVYGEERNAARLAAELVRVREVSPVTTSGHLLAAMERVWRRPVHAADKARVFQALRIAVNQELETLERALPVLRDLVAPGGRMAVISYHSLEDRLVKRAFRDWSRECICPPGLPVCRCRGRPLGRALTRRPQRPAAAEVERNPRARSARLRVWERADEV